ncbi:MAG TPA: 1-deoxy-D-xylulose-5-phosphate reductoisomerase, partial [Candidatus Olsenella stercoravium]|nr:1-deoxy-D-xylulose-5-phosphate reductoisomerase [Candidatus Olsenella stercoravium]
MTRLVDRAAARGIEGPLRVAILGCSGSIGTQTLDVCRRHADRVRVIALSVDSSTSRLVAAAREFGVSHVAVANEAHADDPVLQELPDGCELGCGADAVTALSTLPDVDVVVNALVGFAGMHAGHAALAAGKTLAYANK